MTGKRQTSFKTIVMGGCAAVAMLASVPAHAQAMRPTHFEVGGQDLKSALQQFAKQGDQQVLFSTQIVAGKRSMGVSGDLAPESALKALLAGTGLTYTKTAEGALLVVTAAEAQAPRPQPQSAGDGAEGNAVEELVVTAQKKEESIQSVPIAVSAFSQKSLEEQKIEGGPDLLKAIPNVTFSKGNFSGYNLSIRGIGTKAVAVSTDPAVAISFNNTPVIRNRLFEQEYFDVERVEVLRGPQGTLYGRNATAGVVNMITAKPTSNFEGGVKAEVGNYNSRRLSAFVNVPIGDTLAVRVAGAATQRDGFDYNSITDNKVNGRDLWSGRVSVDWKPVDRFKAEFVWEHFDENDDRSRTGKQLCTTDPGPASLPGLTAPMDATTRGRLSQGCLPGSLYSSDAFGAPNGLSLPLVQTAQVLVGLGYLPSDGSLVNLLQPGVDPYGNLRQSTDLRTIASKFDPKYRAKNDVFQLNLDYELTPDLKLSSQMLYSKDDYYSSQDYNRFNTVPVFNDSSGLNDPFTNLPGGPGLTPGGIYVDPQLGASNTIVGLDITQARSKQWSQEFRLQSSFDGPVNFSAGANYLRYETDEDYYVLFNLASAIADGFFNALALSPGQVCPPGDTGGCVYKDPNPVGSINGEGHNYFRSRNPYKVESSAVFGEVYWNVTDDIKITGGLRYTNDRKQFTPVTSQLLLSPGFFGGGFINSGFPDPNSPLDPTAPGYQGRKADIKQSWNEFTGRLGVDWKPELSFTDQTLVYAFYSRGYKGGGANPPGIGANPEFLTFAANPTTYRPEFVNAFEIGTKNSLFGGSVILNGSAFYYDYKDYQVSKIIDRTALNENFDAKVWGLELESVWQPTRNFRMNANLGYLNTRLAKGSQSIDVMDRTQGNPEWTLVRPWLQLTSSCVARTSDVVKLLNQDAAGSLPFLCGGSGLFGDFRPGGTLSQVYGVTYDPAVDGPNGGAGVAANVGGNDLPNSPHFTLNLGAQYTWNLPTGWDVVLRGDYYRQSESFARVYNTEYDRLKSWDNANLSLTVRNLDAGLTFQIYAKNLFDKTPLTDAFTNSDDTGLTTNVFTLDPRLIGLSVAKTF